MGSQHFQVETPTVTVTTSPQSPLSCEPAMGKSFLCSKRRVHFSDAVTFMDDSDNDVDAMQVEYEDDNEETFFSWYTQRDFDIFRAQNLVMLQQGRQDGTYVDNNDWTPRGFEYVVERIPRKRIRMEHSCRVLQFQEVLTVECPAALADYASNSSETSGSPARARGMGITDEQEAIQIHQQAPQVLFRSCEKTTSSRGITSEHYVPVWSRTMLKFFRCF